MVVDSPKTEHLPGKAQRAVPIFTQLRPYLEEAFELAVDGENYVVSGPFADHLRTKASGPSGWASASLSTRLAKLVRRAGLVPWPKGLHNLRSSCETDLLKTHPIHVVTTWIGNSPSVALRHYAQTTDADFERAIAGTSGAESGAVVVQKCGAKCGADRNRQRSS
jgi:hypothetical protein